METIDALLERIACLEKRLAEQDNENTRLKKRVEELEQLLKQYADSKAAKKRFETGGE